jgi:hypothetical protein
VDQDTDLTLLDLDELLEGSLDFDASIMDEYQASKLMRAVRMNDREVKRLEDYKKLILAEVDEKVGGKIRQLNEATAAHRELIKLYLQETNQTKVSFPDLGTAHFSTTTKYDYVDDLIKEWAAKAGSEHKSVFIKQVESIDKTALKNLATEQKLTIPGFSSRKETGLVLKLEK